MATDVNVEVAKKDAEIAKIVDTMAKEVAKELSSTVLSPRALSAAASSAMSMTIPPPMPVPVIDGFRFVDASGSPYWPASGPLITGIRVEGAPRLGGGFTVVLTVQREAPPAPPAPVHDMTPVALELANLLQAERLKVRELVEKIERQDEGISVLLKEKSQAIHSAEELGELAEKLRDELYEARDKHIALESRVEELIRKNDLLDAIVDEKSSAISILEDKLDDAKAEVLELEGKIRRMREEL